MCNLIENDDFLLEWCKWMLLRRWHRDRNETREFQCQFHWKVSTRISWRETNPCNGDLDWSRWICPVIQGVQILPLLLKAPGGWRFSVPKMLLGYFRLHNTVWVEINDNNSNNINWNIFNISLFFIYTTLFNCNGNLLFFAGLYTDGNRHRHQENGHS